MDCAICIEAITKQTGLVTLSCEHSFHLRCIDEWFCKQLISGTNQTCPCCRSEGNTLDRCAFEEVEEEEDDDESYEDDESEAASEDEEEGGDYPDFNSEIRWERLGPGRWIVSNSREMAYESLRSLFGPLNELEVQEETSQEVAARKIQAIFRGYTTRTKVEVHTAADMLLYLFNRAY
jgi:hypothetical protein